MALEISKCQVEDGVTFCIPDVPEIYVKFAEVDHANHFSGAFFDELSLPSLMIPSHHILVQNH